MDVMDGVGMYTVGGDTAEVYWTESLVKIDTAVLKILPSVVYSGGRKEESEESR